MDAKKFIKEYQRMCRSYLDCYGGCPAHTINDGCHLKFVQEELVDVVEQWSMTHPVVTNRMKFEEVFGEDVLSDREKLLGWWWDEPYKSEV